MIDIALRSQFELATLAAAFAALALIVHGRAQALARARRASADSAVNIVYFLTDVWVLNPVFTLAAAWALDAASRAGLPLAGHGLIGGWLGTLPWWAQLGLALYIADFAGYWRHRLLHCRALWPIHSVHHSDPNVTWLSLFRFHPLNRALTTAVGLAALVLLGFPAWAVVANGIVRNLYGHFVHAGLPWDYGPLGRVFVSPRMHRWHHATDARAYKRNFATLFAVTDLMFATYWLPARSPGALGVPEPDYPTGWLGQTLHPFRVWIRRVGWLTPARLTSTD